MKSAMCTPETVAREVLSRRREINEYIRNGAMTDACSELNVHKCAALDTFQKENPDHGDLLLYVSDQIANKTMDSMHPVAFKLHPVTQDRVYATAQDFANLEPLQQDKYDHLVVMKQDVWEDMDIEKRQECLDRGNVALTRMPCNETLRAAGFRKATLVSDAEEQLPSCEYSETQVGPVAFLQALGVHWHEGHYCLNDDTNADRLKNTVQVVCQQRGVKAGVLVVPRGNCVATVAAESLDSLISKIFPNTMKECSIDSVREQVHSSDKCEETNFMAHFPSSALNSGTFEPVGLIDYRAGDDQWTSKNTTVSYNNELKAWILRRKAK